MASEWKVYSDSHPVIQSCFVQMEMLAMVSSFLFQKEILLVCLLWPLPRPFNSARRVNCSGSTNQVGYIIGIMARPFNSARRVTVLVRPIRWDI